MFYGSHHYIDPLCALLFLEATISPLNAPSIPRIPMKCSRKDYSLCNLIFSFDIFFSVLPETKMFRSIFSISSKKNLVRHVFHLSSYINRNVYLMILFVGLIFDFIFTFHTSPVFAVLQLINQKKYRFVSRTWYLRTRIYQIQKPNNNI